MKRNWSITAYLLLLVLAASLPFVGLLAYSIWSGARVARRQAEAETLSQAQLVVAQLRQFLSDGETIATNLAQRPLIRALDPARRDPIFEDFLDLYPQFVDLVVADAAGRILHSVLPPPADKLPAVMEAQWAGPVLRTDRFLIGRPVVGQITRRWVVVLACPIRDETGRPIGALGLPVDLERFQAMFNHVSLLPNAVITVLDEEGIVVARSLEPRAYWIGKSARGLEIAALALTNGQGHIIARGLDDEERIYGSVAVPGIGWRVYAGIPTEVAFASTRAATLRGGVVAAGILLLAAALVYVLGRRINRPVRELHLATEAAAQGRLEARLSMRGPKEIAAVARQFNQMLEARARNEQALRWSRERVRAIVETALDCIITLDHTGRIVEFNPAAERAFGYKREAVLGKDLAELIIPARLREAHHDGFGRSLANGDGPVRDGRIETTAMRADGSEFPVELAVTRTTGSEQRLFIGFLRDITERKQMEADKHKLHAELEERVAHRTAELETLNKELEAFSYSVSHDLRAPLRGIDGFSLALLEEYGQKLDGQGKDYLHRVRAATQRMGQLIDDLLRLASTSRQEMRRERANLSALARTIAAELRQHEPHRQVEFVIAEGIVAHADVQLMRVALQNLLGNAWKFTVRRAEARIEFGVLQPGKKPVYFVRDNGAGFDMAFADKLFGAFQRLHTPAEFAGTGIGLATVQRIIHRHGGKVWAEGEVDKGATFYFTF